MIKLKGERNKVTIIVAISTLLSQHLIEKVDKNNKYIGCLNTDINQII